MLFDPIEFSKRSHAEGYRPEAQGFGPRTDGVAGTVQLPQVQHDRSLSVIDKDGYAVLAEHLAEVHHLLVEGGRAVEVPNADKERLHRPIGVVFGHFATALAVEGFSAGSRSHARSPLVLRQKCLVTYATGPEFIAVIPSRIASPMGGQRLSLGRRPAPSEGGQ